MKKRILFILVVVLFCLFHTKNVLANKACSPVGYSIYTINGINTTEEEAKNNRRDLERKIIITTYKNEPVTVDFLYNPTHGIIFDLLDSANQKYFDQNSFDVRDSDFAQMLTDASAKVTTQKVLLVAHSQGNFYSNAFYDAVADQPGGVPSQSIGVYSVATPANRVAGNGLYLTSSTDGMIAGVVSHSPFAHILKPNVSINFKDTDDGGLGHDFSKIYLAYQGNKIVSDVKTSLSKLKSNDEQGGEDQCISPPKLTLTQKIQGKMFAIIDPVSIPVQNSAIVIAKGVTNLGLAIVRGVFDIGLAIGKGVFNLGLAIANKVASLVASPVITLQKDASGLAMVSSDVGDSIGSTSSNSSNINSPQKEKSVAPAKTTPSSKKIKLAKASSSNSKNNLKSVSVSVPIKQLVPGVSQNLHSGVVSQNSTSSSTSQTGSTSGSGSTDNGSGAENPSTPPTDITPPADETPSDPVDTTTPPDNTPPPVIVYDTVIDKDTTLYADEYNYDNLLITNNATLTLVGDPIIPDSFKGVKINAANITVDPGASISADGKGYGANEGPGVSSQYYTGASYGGFSLGGTLSSVTYGSAIKPLDLGSGGVYSGGGAIYLNVSNTFTDNGNVSADGNTTGSGGSVYVVAENISGHGTVHANGGPIYGNGYFKSPGGGGRIAIHYHVSSFDGKTEVKGGCGSYDGWSMSCGQTGTVGIFDDFKKDLYLNGSTWKFLQADGPFNFNNIYISNGAQVASENGVTLTSNNLVLDKNSSFTLADNQILNIPKITIDGGATLTLSGTEKIIADTLTVSGVNSTVTVLSERILSLDIPNITVNSGSAISADIKGYGPNSGPGVSSQDGVGASYGGGHGDSSLNTYGSAINPTDLGSGGAQSGGGAIKLIVSNTLKNDGVISANGYPSGSGGSLKVDANNITGSGKFSADGGALYANGYYKSPGGGGRVAVYYKTSTFNGITEAKGGCGSYDGWSMSCASDGTVGIFDETNNDLYLKGSSWRFLQADAPFSFNNIYVSKGAKVASENGVNITANKMVIDENSSFNLAENQVLNIPTIAINGSSIVTLSGSEKITANTLTLDGTNSQITIAPQKILYLNIPNITIGSGSYISADGKGYERASGPGLPSTEYAGASYGGVGSGNTPTSVYGSETEPVDFGSGGNGAYAQGGGAIRIIATNNFTNNGIISAGGNTASSGGSIYVTANNLSGGGIFQANGGGFYCPYSCYSPGGGGRVAVYYQSSSFAGTAVANGYNWSGASSSDGTVHIVDKSAEPVSSNPPTEPNPPTDPALTRSSLKAITAFNFTGLTPNIVGIINETNHTVSLTVPFGADVTALVPAITISGKASVSPNNSVAQNFSSPITYTVTAEDSTTQNYVVTVTASSDPNPPIVSDTTVTQLKIITPPQTINAGNSSTVVTVESEDISGVLAKVASTTHVILSSSSPTGTFASASASKNSCDNDWTKTGITISKGNAHESFCYEDSTSGTPTITISADGLSSDSQIFTIN